MAHLIALTIALCVLGAPAYAASLDGLPVQESLVREFDSRLKSQGSDYLYTVSDAEKGTSIHVLFDPVEKGASGTVRVLNLEKNGGGSVYTYSIPSLKFDGKNPQSVNIKPAYSVKPTEVNRAYANDTRFNEAFVIKNLGTKENPVLLRQTNSEVVSHGKDRYLLQTGAYQQGAEDPVYFQVELNKDANGREEFRGSLHLNFPATMHGKVVSAHLDLLAKPKPTVEMVVYNPQAKTFTRVTQSFNITPKYRNPDPREVHKVEIEVADEKIENMTVSQVEQAGLKVQEQVLKGVEASKGNPAGGLNIEDATR